MFVLLVLGCAGQCSALGDTRLHGSTVNAMHKRSTTLRQSLDMLCTDTVHTKCSREHRILQVFAYPSGKDGVRPASSLSTGRLTPQELRPGYASKSAVLLIQVIHLRRSLAGQLSRRRQQVGPHPHMPRPSARASQVTAVRSAGIVVVPGHGVGVIT